MTEKPDEISGANNSEADKREQPVSARLHVRARRTLTRRGLFGLSFLGISRLTGRILAINLLSVVILFVGVLYLDRYQNSLIRGELDALERQAEVVARAVAELAVETDLILEGTLSPELVQRITRRLSVVLASRIRVYRPDGSMIADSRVLTGPGGTVRIAPLPPPVDRDPVSRFFLELYTDVVNWLPSRSGMPLWEDYETTSAMPGEVDTAIKGQVGRQVRATGDGALMLSVAVPVQRYKQVLGALMLSVEGDEIDKAIREVRLEILGVFGVVFGITVLLSFYLAGTITRPVQRLAAAVERVRASRDRSHEIPDMSQRRDEIGDLSKAIGEMTEELRRRVDAIERFAADVAHEIKNPLTSLRSAVETAARLDDPERQKRLMAVILDDVGRLDRLISDISDASRIDAEMSREIDGEIEVSALIATLADVYSAIDQDDAEGPKRPRVRGEIESDEPLMVRGNEGRLVQVLRNLIENAITFSPPGGEILLRARRQDGQVRISVEDQGPGIPDNKIETIFERFYTERPESEKFGTHSGLGLSISKQIIEGHGGLIHAENRRDALGATIGARFVILLPLVPGAKS